MTREIVARAVLELLVTALLLPPPPNVLNDGIVTCGVAGGNSTACLLLPLTLRSFDV